MLAPTSPIEGIRTITVVYIFNNKFSHVKVEISVVDHGIYVWVPRFILPILEPLFFPSILLPTILLTMDLLYALPNQISFAA